MGLHGTLYSTENTKGQSAIDWFLSMSACFVGSDLIQVSIHRDSEVTVTSQIHFCLLSYEFLMEGFRKHLSDLSSKNARAKINFMWNSRQNCFISYYSLQGEVSFWLFWMFFSMSGSLQVCLRINEQFHAQNTVYWMIGLNFGKCAKNCFCFFLVVFLTCSCGIYLMTEDIY